MWGRFAGHRIIRAGLFGLILSAFGALGAQAQPGPQPPSAAGVGNGPPGSYRQSCTRITMRRGVLYAYCLSVSHAWVPTQLKLAGCITGRDIRNLDGQLACDRLPPPPPPPGSYLKSCSSIKVRHGVLSAYCLTVSRAWVKSRLNLVSCRPGGDIRNIDGQLTCVPRPAMLPPPGAYLQSCRGVHLEGQWLIAECANMQGHWRPTRLALSACGPHPKIVNFNGALICR